MKTTLFVVVLSFVVSFPVLAKTKIDHFSSSAKSEHSVAKINLNKADTQELTHSFKGIGKKRAEAIVAYRKMHGNFKSLRELSAVKGIGKSFVYKNLYQMKKVFVVE